MNTDEFKKYDRKDVTVTLDSGEKIQGRFSYQPTFTEPAGCSVWYKKPKGNVSRCTFPSTSIENIE